MLTHQKREEELALKGITKMTPAEFKGFAYHLALKGVSFVAECSGNQGPVFVRLPKANKHGLPL